MKPFTIYPAIDLRGGKVVRLTQGDPDRQTVYSNDPVEIAQRWLETGATWLHVVNLDGAFESNDNLNQDAIVDIFHTTQSMFPLARLQLGGGLRSLESIERVLQMGVQRAILGTAAIYQPEILSEALYRWGSECIAVAVDAVDGIVQARGWVEGTGMEILALAERLVHMGVRTIIYTNITRDGTGIGVDFHNASRLAAASGMEVIASGGVNSLEDVRLVRQAGLEGVVIGRALYDGRIDLKEALAC